MERSEQIDALAAALVEAQKAIEPAPKDSENPHFKSRYADLATVWAACRDALTTNGLAIVQTPEPGDGDRPFLLTTLLHKSGQWISSRTPLHYGQGNMQSLGSAITYARRYALAAMVGVVSEEDDDGEAASAPAREQARRQPPPSDVNGHADRPPARREPPRDDRPPKDGRQLYAWLKGKEETHEIGLLKYIGAWAKLQDFPAQLRDFSPEQVQLAHREALVKLQSVAGSN